MIWLEGNRVQVKPPEKPKKLTGTRFASVLGLNPWSTPFAVWCEITRVYQEPFVDTVYTRAGKAIEPRQIEYMRRAYAMTDILTPTAVYGAGYFKTTRGDFFPKEPIFGGMWDALIGASPQDAEVVQEYKTTKRSEDWAGDIPEYYALQAALYAWLSGIEDVQMIASFLEDKDYAAPEFFEPSAKNTIVREFSVSERYPDFEEKLLQVKRWWKDHVLTGISPEFDEKRDAAILKELRTNKVASTTESELSELLSEMEALQIRLERIRADNRVVDLEKRLRELKREIKTVGAPLFRPGDTTVELPGMVYTPKLTRKSTNRLDIKAIKQAGLFEQFSKTSETLRLGCTKKEDI